MISAQVSGSRRHYDLQVIKIHLIGSCVFLTVLQLEEIRVFVNLTIFIFYFYATVLN